MDNRMEELSKLRSYTDDVDKDLTMILQSLQWDRKHIIQHSTFVTCKYDSNHRVLQDRVADHERECLLRFNGYTKEDVLLPDPLDMKSSTLIKLSKEDISKIIDNASKSDPTFKKVCFDSLYGCLHQYLLFVVGSEELAPQTLGRLQTTYTADERRAIHDAVVSAVPACHDLADLALSSTGVDDKAPKTKSRMEILAELRDMRRRRTKYRVAVKSTNYSHVLRDVIKTQMEVYNEALADTKPNINELNNQVHRERNDTEANVNRERYEQRKEGRSSDREQRRLESNRVRKERRHDEPRDRKHRDGSRERRRDSYKRDNRYRRPSVEIKLEPNEDDIDTERSRRRHRSKDKNYDGNSDSHLGDRFGGELHQEWSRGHYKGHSRDSSDKQGHKDRTKEDYDDRYRDEARARNLLVEIKSEIESAEINESEKYEGHCSTKSRSVKIKNEKRYRDVSKSESYKSSHRDRNREESDRERNTRDDRRDKESRYNVRRDSNSREDRVKHKKYEHNSHKESYRDRSSDNKVKRMRTEDKHNLYNEVYSELEKRKQKRDNNK